jgi:hypothetical protein
MEHKDIFENRARAESLANQYEARIASLGFVGKYFCDDQRARWREQIVRSFMGESPSFQSDFTTPEDRSVPEFPPQLP